MLLEVKDLNVRFATHDGEVKAVNGIDLDVARGETLGATAQRLCDDLGRLLPDLACSIVTLSG